VNDQPLIVGVQLEPGVDADAAEVDELRRGLRARLLELDVDSVETPRTGPAPPGTRGVDLVAAGALIVSLSRSTTLLKMVVDVVQSWAASRPARSVELTVGGNSIKVTGIASDEQRRLIELFIERSTGA
jgi:hypothetical protein